MKYLFLLIFSTLLLSCNANKGPLNTTNEGYIAEGYDVTEYFNDRAVEGQAAFTSMYNGAKYKFVDAANKQKFDANPEKYAPKYGGYCAYAVATSGKKVSINPESYSVEDGELYLFYDSIFADTKKKWNEAGANTLKEKGDMTWNTLKNNQ